MDHKGNDGSPIAISLIIVLALALCMAIFCPWFKTITGFDINAWFREYSGEGETSTVTIGENGNWIIDGEDTNVSAKGTTGEKGEQGKPGETPVITIGANGNWFVDGIDTNVSAKGTTGEKGEQGKPGEQGETPVITIGANGNWFVDGVDTSVKAKGDDGKEARSIEEITMIRLNEKLDRASVLAKENVHERFVEAGIADDSLKSLSGKTCYLYDYTQNRFLVIDDARYIAYVAEGSSYTVGEKIVASTDLWMITGKTISNEFSNYLVADFPTGIIDVTTGLDVGSNTDNITSVSYDRRSVAAPQKAIIRTNGSFTALYINAPFDVVEHYGVAGSLDIVAVGNHSYHEFGSVPFVEIAKGRIVLEETSSVYLIYIDTKIAAIESDGTKTKVDNVFDDIIVNIASGVACPKFERDAVSDIPSTGTLVVEVEKANDESDYIYLYQFGLIEQIKVTTGVSGEAAIAIDDSALDGNDDTLEDNTKSIVYDLANNLKEGKAEATSFDDVEGGLDSDVDVEEIKYKTVRKDELAVYDENGVFVENISLLEFRDNVNNEVYEYDGWTIKVLKDLDYTDIEWVPIGLHVYGGQNTPFYGIFDGNNKTIKVKNSDIDCSDYFGFFGYVYSEDEVNTKRIYDLNLEVDFTASTTAMTYNAMGGLVSEIDGFIDIENVTVSGSIVSNRVVGGLVGNAYSGNHNITDCHVFADITSMGLPCYGSNNWQAIGGLIGQSNASEMIIKDCSYTGTLRADYSNCEVGTNPYNGGVSYMGYVMAKGATDGGNETTVIENFTVGDGSEIIGFAAKSTHNYPFEGYNAFDDANTYVTAPNPDKELVGGYFHVCTIDGVTEDTSSQNHYPHG